MCALRATDSSPPHICVASESCYQRAMAWLRSPIFYGLVLLCVGAVLRAILAVPENPQTLTPEQLRRALEYHRDARPVLTLEPRYHPYVFAFMLAGSAAEVEAVKRKVDEELAESDAVRERGLAGVPEYAADALAAPDIVLMALGAALVFRGLAFVLAFGFGIGGFHQMMLQSGKLTGAPSEFYLGAILAALIWCAIFWLARALFEGRLRLRA
jgi:hypothetical protein